MGQFCTGPTNGIEISNYMSPTLHNATLQLINGFEIKDIIQFK